MPRTIVFFHAHPDDEAIATGGTMARLASERHRVVLVLATRGELGEPIEGVLEPDEVLGDRRSREAATAGEILGAARVAFLGYVDSGMMGEDTNGVAGSFWSADVEEAAQRLAAILTEEGADVLVAYDDHGTYGHPDHIQVHRVGIRAAEIAGTPRVYEATANRDALRRMVAAMPTDGASPDQPAVRDFDDDFGSSEDVITTRVDVAEFVATKRAAMAAHASQIGPETFFLTMPEDVFAQGFGQEWFIRRDVGSDHREEWLLDDLPERA